MRLYKKGKNAETMQKFAVLCMEYNKADDNDKQRIIADMERLANGNVSWLIIAAREIGLHETTPERVISQLQYNGSAVFPEDTFPFFCVNDKVVQFLKLCSLDTSAKDALLPYFEKAKHKGLLTVRLSKDKTDNAIQIGGWYVAAEITN